MTKPAFQSLFLVGLAALALLFAKECTAAVFGFCFSDLSCMSNAVKITGDVGTDKVFNATCESFRPSILDGKICKTQACTECYSVVGPNGPLDCMPHGGRTDPPWWCYSFK